MHLDLINIYNGLGDVAQSAVIGKVVTRILGNFFSYSLSERIYPGT